MKSLRLIALLSFAATSAFPQVHHVEKQQYILSAAEHPETDSLVYAMIFPYKLRLDSEMNDVISISETAMTKDQPESLLGNFCADALLKITGSGYQPTDHKTIDFCFLNNGGLRSSLPKGELTRRNMFELMPFENEAVILTLEGNLVQEILKWIASKGGVPVSGLKMNIAGGIPTKVLIGNEPFDSLKTYKVLTSDYLAGGGDNLFFLTGALKKEYANQRIRDALIEYCLQEKNKGNNLYPKLDKRIYNE